ncbi:MAG: T9SS type A sorting domain-containing protein [Candidatus Delongbacteria bacterium]|nr:T9SS type A sorting domain-containing protein [Candidatus Delongbacteria bacterium]MBN2834641.1 T9SS type A sorting domain-containing protein [Candidatus Delongbacteria bacterium]
MSRLLFLLGMLYSSVLGNWYNDEVVINGLDFSNIPTSEFSSKGFVENNDYGKPAIPVKYFLLAAPADGNIDVSVEVKNSIVYDGFEFLPKQYPAPEIYNYKPIFLKDDETYTKNSFYPDKLYEISEKIIGRGIAFYQIKVYPVSYNPVTKKTELRSLNLSWKISGNFKIDKAIYSKNFMMNQLSLCLNGQAFNDLDILENKSREAEEGNYLIITHDDFIQAAKKLAIWKNRLGYTSYIAKTSEIGSSEDEIYDFIKNAYDTWTIAPEFVCIIGDVAKSDGTILVPTGYHSGHPANGDQYSSDHLTATDLYYGCVDGNDYRPDINVSRILCDSNSEADLYVEKVINYESSPPIESSFYQNVLNVCYFQDDDHNGYADRRFCQTTEEIRDYTTNILNKTSTRVYYTHSNVNPTNWSMNYGSNGQPIPTELLRSNGFLWNGDYNDIITGLNNGSFLLTHRDHGYSGGWGDPEFNVGNVNQLSNGNKLPVVLSINCETGFFDNETSIGAGSINSNDGNYFVEAWMRHSNGGAINYIGATRLSYSGQNDFYAEALYNAITGYQWANSQNSYGDDFDTFNSVNFNEGENQVSVANNYAKMYYLTKGSYYDLYTKCLFEEFTCFGDPALKIWLDEPNTFDFSLEYEGYDKIDFYCSVANLTFTITDSYGNKFGQMLTNSGMNSIDLNITSTDFDKLFLTISGTGFKPYIYQSSLEGSTLLSSDILEINESMNSWDILTLPIQITNSMQNSFLYNLDFTRDGEISYTMDNSINIFSASEYNFAAGIETFDGFIWVSSQGKNTAINPNKFLKFDYDGNLVAEYDQITNSVNGILDLTKDDDFIYGIDGLKVYKMNPQDGSQELLFTFNIPGFTFLTGIAAGDENIFYLYSSINSRLVAVDHTGNLIKEYVYPGINQVYGISYDPKHRSLWLLARSGEPQSSIYKYSIDRGEIVGSPIQVEKPQGVTTQTSFGSCISYSKHPGKCTTLNIITTDIGPAIIEQVLYESWLYGNSSVCGEIPAGESSTIEIVCNSYGYSGTNHSGSVLLSDGIVSLEIPVNLSVTTDIDENEPDNFILFGNYPNPFNPETSIVYHNNNTSSIIFSVYNINGEKVYSKSFNNQETGINTITFNGDLLSSGIYYYNLSKDNKLYSGKMILLK